MIKVKLEAKKFVRGLKRLRSAHITETNKTLFLAGTIVQFNVQKLLRQGPSRTGKIYTTFFYTDSSGRVRPVGQRSIPHQASAPGEPPATDQGDLGTSIFVRPEPANFKVIVGTNLIYGMLLELGTDGGKILPRPWLFPTFETSKPEIRKLFASRFRATNRKSLR